MHSALFRHIDRSKRGATLESSETELCVYAYSYGLEFTHKERAFSVDGVSSYRNICKSRFGKSVIARAFHRFEVFYCHELRIAAERMVAHRRYFICGEHHASKFSARSESIAAKDALIQLLSLIVPQNDSFAAESIRNIVENTLNTDRLVSFLNDVLRSMPDMPERQTLYDALETVMEDVVKSYSQEQNTDVSAEKAAILVYLSKLSGGAESAEKVLSSIVSGESAEADTEARNEAYKSSIALSDSRIEYILNNYQSNVTSGKDAIDQLLALLIPRDNPDASEVMKTVVNGTDNLSDLVDFLNRVLENTPDIPERQTLCDAFEHIVGGMAQKQEMLAQKQSGYESETMKALTAFIDRNVNHPAIRGIDNFNASNLLQSMLNAPGVFTPLAHYIIPLQVDDTRAFGELWVDNDNTSSGKSENGEKKYHLFLTFDVEAVGRFEVDVYSSGKELNLSVLYPKSYRYRVSNLTDKITKIAAGVGYSVQNFKTGILFKPHTLAETFPRINENRKSFDVKA